MALLFCIFAKMKITPRRWQQEASARVVERFLQGTQKHFLVEAGVGSGKTIFSLLTAALLRDYLPKIVTVAPQYSVKRGFVDTFAGAGIQLDAVCDSGRILGFDGYACTYQGLLTNEHVKSFVDDLTMVVLDEPHHLLKDEQSAWYRAALDKLGDAGMILCMTGTPYREEDKQIPFCRYVKDNGVMRIDPDYSYTYGDSVRDGVCARVNFIFTEGNAVVKMANKRRMIATGTAMAAQDEGLLLKSLLDPRHNFIRDTLGRFIEKIMEVRRTDPKAGGLIVCVDIKHAKAVEKVLDTFGIPYDTVTGDDSKGQTIIHAFRTSTSPIINSVKMISEGTDIPRLKVLCYLSNVRSNLFLMQVMGRVVRKTTDLPEECYMILPNSPSFKRFARMVEHGIRHSIEVKEEPEDWEEEEGDTSDMQENSMRKANPVEILSTTYNGEVNMTLFDGFEFNTAPLLTDRREGLRAEVASLTQRFGKHLAIREGGDISEFIREAHRQANALVKVKSQNDMTLEELEEKAGILREWVKDHGVRI